MEIEKIKELLDEEPEEIVEKMLADIKKQYGEVPYIVNFIKDMPELFISRMIYTNSIMREFKRMDPKTVELISIAVASALKCGHCLKTHIRAAKRLGVSKEEIFDTILISSTVANASILAEGTRAIDTEFASTVEGKDPSCMFCTFNSELQEQK
ncbi:alkylhydroperoxidase AhpD family core domain protein [Methanomethylovorans hollandica DSM 15978]|uniref:Alkylhydroperoxidase AhpD family core domain protein n=1 Tax=Methanomethylovorans hollandica (strain DSM 15978 / NBRC 107637 / DMS1) TaxID=867904 RepID=L0KWU9_METHD|nr:carboxymuconolactone decarboxylase family protein [Methanomethylovorans hollandica]AGB48444.1 alkylhydroperoxidase AhpD family core domain protein [Methanomethylovorans hollandica DSM 15978]